MLKKHLTIRNVISLITIITGCILFLSGELYNSYELQVFGITFIWLNNMFFSLYNIKKRVIFFFLNVTMFTLLISRPLIATIRGSKFWYFPYNNINFALTGVFFSLLFLFIGSLVATIFTKKVINKSILINQDTHEDEKTHLLRITSGVLYIISILSTLLINIEKYLYAKSTSYLEFHAGFTSHLPFFIKGFSLFSTFALCIFLATFPTKKRSITMLALYVLTTVPTFLMGSRNSLVLSFLFALVYVIMRSFYDKKESWFGKKEGIIIGAMVPPGLFGLGIMNYLRAGESAPKGIFSIIIDFFYKQGTTFDTLSIGYKFMDKLPFSEIKLYTFGPFLDALKYGVISQKLFGMRSMNEGNNYYRGIASYQLANNLDYVSRWKDFFKGNGFGSSFILETYLDFGYIGVIISSFIFGVLTILFIVYFRKNKIFINIFILTSLISFFFLPRDATLRWAVFILKPSFWMCVCFCYVGAFLLSKFKSKKIVKYFSTLFN